MSKEHGSGAGTEMVYIVEARSIYIEPQQHCGMTLDQRWRRVNFQKAPIGVPVHLLNKEARGLGFLNYGAALALAYWFLAAEEFAAACVEVRIVEVEFTWRYETKEIGVSPPINAVNARRDAQWSKRDDEQIPKRQDGR